MFFYEITYFFCCPEFEWDAVTGKENIKIKCCNHDNRSLFLCHIQSKLRWSSRYFYAVESQYIPSKKDFEYFVSTGRKDVRGGVSRIPEICIFHNYHTLRLCNKPFPDRAVENAVLCLLLHFFKE